MPNAGPDPACPACFREAGRLGRAVLNWCDTVAITAPWPFRPLVYYLKEARESGCWDDIVAHELVHIAQIKRDGCIVFSVRYLWGLAWYGYWDMPYEQAARAVHSNRPLG